MDKKKMGGGGGENFEYSQILKYMQKTEWKKYIKI